MLGEAIAVPAYVHVGMEDHPLAHGAVLPHDHAGIEHTARPHAAAVHHHRPRIEHRARADLSLRAHIGAGEDRRAGIHPGRGMHMGPRLHPRLRRAGLPQQGQAAGEDQVGHGRAQQRGAAGGTLRIGGDDHRAGAGRPQRAGIARVGQKAQLLRAGLLQPGYAADLQLRIPLQFHPAHLRGQVTKGHGLESHMIVFNLKKFFRGRSIMISTLLQSDRIMRQEYPLECGPRKPFFPLDNTPERGGFCSLPAGIPEESRTGVVPTTYHTDRQWIAAAIRPMEGA